LRQCHQVLNNDGILFIITPNRYTILSEPHVNGWGVGFLPRKWMKSYVKMIRGISYENIHVLSFFEMKRLLKESLFNRYKFFFSSITKEVVEKFSTFERIQVAIYRLVNRLAVLRPLLYIFSPVFHIICSPKKSI